MAPMLEQLSVERSDRILEVGDGAPHASPMRHVLPAISPTLYAGQCFDHRESGGTADAPDLGSGARKGVGVRLSPLAPPPTCGSSFQGLAPKSKPWSTRLRG
jgi:hypothetical protein